MNSIRPIHPPWFSATAALVLTLALALAMAGVARATENARALEIFGWVERVELLDGKISLKAKLDTGALTSSLDATDIERFDRDGERWVGFTVTDDDSGMTLKIERPLVRNVRIVRHSGESQRRPVVTLPVCFGEFYDEVEFSLIDRSNFIYPVLLGRSALEGRALVDSADTFTNYPACEYSDNENTE